ncbi:Sec24 [Spironucleus salmonicida]|uniref:Sec24 n=1 Tax=Spironucleus salmonicida TaxID=348837 RepID=V6LLX7_9EUKA|nr:Sec24 [Spironucleus salmonicida]|eukprot:EST41709.1 Sec24 [Spironucleus salmonicida]
MNLPSPSLLFLSKYGEQQTQKLDQSKEVSLLPNAINDPELAKSTFSTISSYTYLESILHTQSAINFQPFAKSVTQANEIPIRCKRCKAYLQDPFIFNGKEFQCQICGRQNQTSSSLTSIPPNPVEFNVQDYVYSSATVDLAGTRTEFLYPGEIGHIQSEVLSHPEILKAAMGSSKFQRDFRGSKDPKIPSSERCLEKVLKTFDTELLGKQEYQESNIDTYRFVHVFIVQTTFNSIYQGILECVLSQIENFLLTSHPNIQVAICFSQMQLQFFQKITSGFEIYEVVSDPVTGEPMIPIPVDELCFDSTLIEEFKEFKQFILQYYYQDIQNSLERYKLAPSSIGDSIGGIVSSLQRIGGIVNVILTDRPTFGVGAIPPEDIKTYTYTSHDNAATAKEAAYFNSNLYYNRLAREAVDHNISINIVGLPFNNFSLGLQCLAPLTFTTAGSLYYNEPARLANEIQSTGNYAFLTDCLRDIFETEAIACTFTARCSQGIDLMLTEEIQTEEIDGVVNSAKNLLNTIFKQKATQQNNLKTFKYKTKDQVYGSFSKLSDVELSFASMKKSSCFSAKLRLQIQKFQDPKIQFAVLFTSQDGKRRVRTGILGLACSEIAAQIYNSCDQFQLVSFASKRFSSAFLGAQGLQNKDQGPLGGLQQNSKQAVSKVEVENAKIEEGSKNGNLSEIEIKFCNELSEVALNSQISSFEVLSLKNGGQKLINQYKMQGMIMQDLKLLLKGFKDIAGASQQSKLLIPQSMQLVPLYMHVLARTGISHAHRNQNEGGMFTSDMRVAEACFNLQENYVKICNNLVPGVFNVNALLGANQAILRPISANSMSIVDVYKNCYLFVSGRICVLAIGRSVPKDVIQELIGEENGFYIQQFRSDNLNANLKVLKQVYGFKGGIYISKDEGVLEGLRRWMIVEDGSSRDMSYQEFLQSLPSVIAK